MTRIIKVPAKNIGANRYGYYKRLLERTDLSDIITHLTKPTQDDLNAIFRDVTKIDSAVIHKINCAAVDRLVQILKDQCILGSTTATGFIAGKRPAACFQDVPLLSILKI
ncbi:hypothetical protein [Desulfosporosinus sp. Sb-LF]|uniref:hypothetical protein n=1 Tax=Desulfosporosinus sp. Sb-LF TaxID=2560027 RepID=UPI00107F31CB|nr:hypothetical protein [Desulfosporosinus sp. Sb-LF]TGE34337.1 hypothetical protein E4K68_01150 [Desulfosporosinus sp. Sb-LF]